METDIVRIGPADAQLLDRVAEDVFDHEVDPRRLAAYLADSGHLMVVAVCDGEVIGQARGMVHRQPDQANELYIDNLGVTPGRQREGIATRLLDELTAWSRDHGCEGAWVATEPDNQPALALYTGRGAEAEQVAYFYYEP